MSIEKGWEAIRRMQAVSDEEVASMNNSSELSPEVISAGIRYYHSDPGLSEAILVQGIYEAMKAANGKQQGGDDGMPMVCVTQEFKDQADYDAEISSAASNLLRNNTLGLSGSLPEMVAALLKLASGQQVGEVQAKEVQPVAHSDSQLIK
ncbi:hypothetical protein [Stenotrophomonas phage SOVA965]